VFVDLGNAPDIDSSEAGLVGVSAPDIHDLAIDGGGASDGDGAMLGSVLIYAGIIAVVAVTIWKWVA
jgi:hypothetical protein